MEKYSDKELLDWMRKLRVELEDFRVREWRVARSKYLQNVFSMLREHGKV